MIYDVIYSLLVLIQKLAFFNKQLEGFYYILNLNLVDHRTNAKLKYYPNIIFKNFLISTKNKPTRITETNATLIYHILTNEFINTDSSAGTVKD